MRKMRERNAAHIQPSKILPRLFSIRKWKAEKTRQNTAEIDLLPMWI
jgi:hypothetical protein